MDEHLCVYCNGLSVLYINCPACKSRMEDCGALQNVLGPYAPYEENELTMSRDGCMHQVYCPLCDLKYNLTIPTN